MCVTNDSPASFLEAVIFREALDHKRRTLL
jgi:hypothetical protein